MLLLKVARGWRQLFFLLFIPVGAGLSFQERDIYFRHRRSFSVSFLVLFPSGERLPALSVLGVVESRAVIKWLLITLIMGDCGRTPPAPAGRWGQEPREGRP